MTAADEVGRLQRGQDAECSLFQGFCEEGHYGGRTKPSNTRQGMYAVAPSGRFLASCNTRNPDSVARMLRTALARWAELPAEQRRLSAEQRADLTRTRRFEDRYPEDGLVLAEYCRDLDTPVVERDWRSRAWNEDQVWFTRLEAQAMLPRGRAVGLQRIVPWRLSERFARLHLIDSVRGQTPAFPRHAVEVAELHTEIVAIDGPRLRVRLTGRARLVAKGRWAVRGHGEAVPQERGIEVDMLGAAVWDDAAQRFTAFELLAVGDRWGGTPFNERGDDRAKSRIGFAFRLAPKDHPRVAPAFWWEYGWR